MDPKDKLLTGSVLETTVDQLAIVGGTMPRISLGDKSDFPHPNISDSPLDSILLHDNKTMQSRGHNGRELHTLALKRLSSETIYARRVLEASLLELREGGREVSGAGALALCVRRSRSRKDDKHDITEREKVVRDEIAALKTAIEEAKELSEFEAKQDNLVIARLRDALQEARRSSRGEEEFVRQLESIREKERGKRMEEEEHNIVVWRDDLKREIEHEQRVTLEIESWLNDRKATLKALHKHWTEKLLSDVAAKDRTLSDLTSSREADATRRLEKINRLRESEVFVRTEREKRELEKRRKERVELEVRTAIRIQSWWRMMMVRKGLGPYRRKKQKTSKQEEQRQQQHKVSTSAVKK